MALAGKKGVYDFWPLRIVGKGDEKIWLMALPRNGYCILKVFVWISSTFKEGWW